MSTREIHARRCTSNVRESRGGEALRAERTEPMGKLSGRKGKMHTQRRLLHVALDERLATEGRCEREREMDGWMDGRTDGRMDGRTDGWIIDTQIDTQTDR